MHGDANSASVLDSLKTSKAALSKGGLRKEEGSTFKVATVKNARF